MGNTISSPMHKCLLSAVGWNSSLVAFQNTSLYQAIDVNPYNLNFPVTPAAVTFPRTTEQVSGIVKCAADEGYKVQAKSGGHSYGNYGLGGSDGAIVVDLRHFQQFSMDNSTYIATIGAGTLLGDVTTRLHHAGGRAMAHGTCPQVGAGGHFTIGGLGPTSRQWGAALDHIEEVEVVLANSSVVRASNTQNEDVFFAIRGAASSFGIITKFKVHTHPAPDHAVQYSYTFNFGNTTVKSRFFKDWQAFVSDPQLSRKFTTSFIIFETGVVISGTFFGNKSEFDAFRSERRLPGTDSGNDSSLVVLDDWKGMMGNDAENFILKAGGSVPNAFYAKSLPISSKTLIPSSVIDDMFHYFDTAKKGTLAWFVMFDLEGGATNDPAVNSTAYAHRDTLFWLQSYAMNPLGKISNKTVNYLDGINRIVDSSFPGVDLGAYPGYIDRFLNNSQTRYWGSNLPRLQEIKARLDPGDVFHNPQSVAAAKTSNK